MLNPRFTRGEYWLLEAVAEYALSINVLGRPDIEEALNKTGHGMARSLLVETMRGLFQQGLIVAHRFRDDWGNCFEFSSDQIEAALDEPSDNAIYYHLTEEGGRQWEAFARPNWSSYINVEFTPHEDHGTELGQLICAEKDLLQGYVRWLRSSQYDIDEGSKQFDTLAPWKATYWKTLPLGHRIRFGCAEKTNQRGPIALRLGDQLWYDMRWYRWR